MKPRIRKYLEGPEGWICGVGNKGFWGATPKDAFECWMEVIKMKQIEVLVVVVSVLYIAFVAWWVS